MSATWEPLPARFRVCSRYAPGSLDVKIEDKNVHLLSDAMVNNCGSPPNSATTPGVIQAPNVVLPVLEFDSNEFKQKTANMQSKNGTQWRADSHQTNV
ncbi:MAG TPA: hypothetical protein VI072_03095 [Polyangiaceae bacterium]